MRTAIIRARELSISGPEIINLLVAVEAICRRRNAVTLLDLETALNVTGDWSDHVKGMDYFDLVSSLYFSRRKTQFSEARDAITLEIERRIIAAGRDLPSRTAETMLFFDLISCPHVEHDRRRDLLRKVTEIVVGTPIGIGTAATQTSLLAKTLGFITWDGAKSLHALLERKELQPAYD